MKTVEELEKEVLELKHIVTHLGRENTRLKGFKDCSAELVQANAEIFDLKRELLNWKKLGDIDKAAEDLSKSKIEIGELKSNLQYYKDLYEYNREEIKEKEHVIGIIYMLLEHGVEYTIDYIKENYIDKEEH